MVNTPPHYSIGVFRIWPILIITSVLCIFICFYITNYHPFISARRTPFRISSKPSLVVMKSTSICLFEKVCILPSFQRMTLLDQVFLIGSFFPLALWIYLSTLPCPGRSLLREPVIALEVSYVRGFFFLLLLLKFSLSLLLNRSIIIVLEKIILYWNFGWPISFMNLDVQISSHICEICSHSFFK